MQALYPPTPTLRTAPRVLTQGLALMCLGFVGAVMAAPRSPTTSANEVGLGTLFYSPVQRDEIVRARHGMAGSEVELTQKRLSGVVRRAGGKSTVWLNGEALQEGGSDAPALVGMDAVVGERRLRVGQSVDTLTGETSDLVPPGSVRASGSRSGK